MLTCGETKCLLYLNIFCRLVSLDGSKGEQKLKTIKILKMVYYPELLVWVSQEPFLYKEMEGSLKGRLPVPKEVNRKKAEEISAASLAPPGSHELCSPNISYLYSF